MLWFYFAVTRQLQEKADDLLSVTRPAAAYCCNRTTQVLNKIGEWFALIQLMM